MDTRSDAGSAGDGLLFTPFETGGLRIPNRIVLTAMVTRLSGIKNGYSVEDATPPSWRGDEPWLRIEEEEEGKARLEWSEAYDLAGNRSDPTPVAEVRLSPGEA
jgi:hypothetical protein